MQGEEPAGPQCVSVCLSLLTERSRPTSGWSELQTENMSQRKEEGFNEHFSSLKVREINMTLGTRGGGLLLWASLQKSSWRRDASVGESGDSRQASWLWGSQEERLGLEAWKRGEPDAGEEIQLGTWGTEGGPNEITC